MVHMREWLILSGKLEKYKVECGTITGAILGKFFADYVIFHSFSVLLLVVGAVFTSCSLIAFSSWGKIQQPSCE